MPADRRPHRIDVREDQSLQALDAVCAISSILNAKGLLELGTASSESQKSEFKANIFRYNESLKHHCSSREFNFQEEIT